LGLTIGLGSNTLAADTGYRGAAATAAVAPVLASSWWLRQLPPRAPLVRIASWVLLTLAGLAALLAITAPARWQGWATIAAAVLAVTATLTRTRLYKATTLLAGVAGIGGGGRGHWPRGGQAHPGRLIGR